MNESMDLIIWARKLGKHISKHIPKTTSGHTLNTDHIPSLVKGNGRKISPVGFPSQDNETDKPKQNVLSF